MTTMTVLNHTNTTAGSGSDEGVPLSVIHAHIFMAYLPVIVFTSCLCVVGIVGNVFTVVFYKPRRTRSSTSYLIAALAVVDIIVCLLGIISVLDLCINVLFSERILCKLMYFLDQWMILISVLILWIISIDRYIKLCKPYWCQFTIRRAKVAIVTVTVFSFVVSIRDVITYDVMQVTIENLINGTVSVTGYHCTTSTDPNLTHFIFYSHMFDVGVIAVIIITFAFTYSSIGYRLFEHKQYMKSSSVRPFSFEQDDSSMNSDVQSTSNLNVERITNDNITLGKTRDRVSNEQIKHVKPRDCSHVSNEYIKQGTTQAARTYGTVEAPSCPDHCNKKISVLSTVSVDGFVKSASQMKQSERNVTSMMFAVSIALAVCFAPYFIVSVTARRNNPGRREIQPLVQLAVRTPFWNSVVNPILFTMFNPKYRKSVKKSLCSCCIKGE